MKKFMLGLLAFLGMAVCFTACGDKEDDPTPKQEKTASESGASLYNSYVAYDTYKDDNTTEGTVAKGKAAVDLYLAYQSYQKNKEDKEWINEFSKSAASVAIADKTGIDVADKEAAEAQISEQLKEKLTDGSLLSEDKVKQVTAAAELYSVLSQIF
ncbi:MAG: hypothetical protein J6Y55_10405 [Bacteroidales bacterium]|nr:hypothetical protein [Bacteroidales bacterium]